MKEAFDKTVSALCYSFIRARFGSIAGGPGLSWNRAVRFVLDRHASMPDPLRVPVMVLTLIFDVATYLTDGRSFHRLDFDRRWKRIVKTQQSIFRPFRDLMRFYEGLSVFGFYDELDRIKQDDATIGGLSFAPGPNCNGQSPAPPSEMGSEIAVIGSGPGGAITACLLAEAGREVTLIESGPFFTLEECPQFSRLEMECKYRNGGVTAALGAVKISYIEGQCVGGGSEINAGLYHRTPDNVLDTWHRDYQLESAAPAEMLPYFEACERDVNVSYMPGELPAASLKLQKGAQIKGWKSIEVPRMFQYGSNFPATTGVKQSMTRTFIPRALTSGCKLVPNTCARQLTRRGSDWIVDLERTSPGAEATRHKLRCKFVFICGGAIHTPTLLLASGIHDNVGRSLRMHPTLKVLARFPEPINSLNMGVPVHQVKEFSPRLSFGCSISTPQYLYLAMLDHAAHFNEVENSWPRMAIYYAMITGGIGSVRKLPMCQDPLVTYKLSMSDMHDLSNGFTKLCEVLLAAGAEALYPSVTGLAPLRGPDDLDRIPNPLQKRSANLMTVHLFSSCPMGEDKSRCVADSFGHVHGHKNLYIADASLLCTAPGVNPQGSIMAFARRNVMHFLARRP